MSNRELLREGLEKFGITTEKVVKAVKSVVK